MAKVTAGHYYSARNFPFSYTQKNVAIHETERFYTRDKTLQYTQQNVSIHATKRFYTRDKTFLYTRQNVSIHETKHFHTLHKKFLIVRRFVYTKKNLISDKKRFYFNIALIKPAKIPALIPTNTHLSLYEVGGFGCRKLGFLK